MSIDKHQYEDWKTTRGKTLADPAVKAEYDRLESRYRLIDALIAARKRRGWTQAEVAEAAGMKQSAVARLESGDRDPQMSTVLAVAQALGVSVRVGSQTVTASTGRSAKAS
jgi:transcriptional regulator with XRE-family HTH domain